MDLLEAFADLTAEGLELDSEVQLVEPAPARQVLGQS